MKKLEPILGKWQFCFYAGRSYIEYKRYILRIHIIKLKSFPVPGAMLSRENYDGFIIELRSPKPVTYYVFKVPRRLRWLIPYHFYRIPLTWSI